MKTRHGYVMYLFRFVTIIKNLFRVIGIFNDFSLKKLDNLKIFILVKTCLLNLNSSFFIFIWSVSILIFMEVDTVRLISSNTSVYRLLNLIYLMINMLLSFTCLFYQNLVLILCLPIF